LLELIAQREERAGTVMHRFLQIALDVFWLAAILGGGGWVMFRALKRSEDPAQSLFKLLATSVLVVVEFFFARRMIGQLHDGGIGDNLVQAGALVISIAVSGVVLGVMWTPQIVGFFLSPLTSIMDGGTEPPERKPFYSIALTKRHRGKPHEAVAEIRRQLAQFPNDFEGVMLLARIQAEDLADLAGAENTLNHFCDWPQAPLKQVAAAFTQLADWHMKLAADVNAARSALQTIIARFPDTESALQAEQRIAHLVETEQMMLARHDRQDVAVPEGVQNIGLLDSTDFLKPQDIEPGKLAAAHVKHLEAHPHDAEVREKLAIIYAKDFQRLDLATMELAQLINEPKYKPKQVAQWLNLLANFQVELGADVATVRATLEKIVDSFPNLPVADLAQRRLARLENEFKGLRKSSSVKMGVYEQNIGLKYGGPRKM
jgi:hypothetical protein